MANPERAKLEIQEGYNNLRLNPPIFAERKSILVLCPHDGQVALTSVNVPLSDLQSDPDSTGKHRRISNNRKEALVFTATARYFKSPINLGKFKFRFNPIETCFQFKLLINF